jgi:hypothetical protein
MHYLTLESAKKIVPGFFVQSQTWKNLQNHGQGASRSSIRHVMVVPWSCGSRGERVEPALRLVRPQKDNTNSGNDGVRGYQYKPEPTIAAGAFA